MYESIEQQRVRYADLAKLAEVVHAPAVTPEEDNEPGYDARNDVHLGDDGKEHWGFHLMMDMGGCNENINDAEALERFIKELVPEIGMTAVGEPMIVLFGEPDKNGGYSVLQMITTSNIALHGDNWNGSMYMDVFSCKPFDVDKAIALAKKTFEPKGSNIKFIYRDTPSDKTGEADAVGSK